MTPSFFRIASLSLLYRDSQDIEIQEYIYSRLGYDYQWHQGAEWGGQKCVESYALRGLEDLDA
jgi:hypothetical protein